MLLNKGWTANEMLSVIRNTKQFKVSMYSGEECLVVLPIFNVLKFNKKNLLNQNVFYLHNELKICSKPATIDFDPETGEFKKKSNEYFLEIRADYTIDELITYYLMHPYLYDNKAKTHARIKGALEWLVNQYGIENVLYMIDAANDHICSCNLQKLKNILDIQDYYTNAIEMHQRRYTECKYNGVDKIVPRKRVI